MKKILLLVLVCAVAFGAVACKKKSDEAATQAPAAKNTFIMGLDDSFPPMGFRDANNVIVGFDVDLATEVAKRLNLQLVLQPIDWASKELELNNGNIDCIWNGLSVDADRQEKMLLSKPYLANRMIIVVKADSPIKSKADLKGKQVGLQNGSTAVKSLDNDPISADVIKRGYENNVLALNDLLIGGNRVDAVVMDEIVARYETAKDKQKYRILDDSLATEVYAIGFKKGNKELADKVAAALLAMEQDGTADNISMKWFGEALLLK